MKRLSALLLAVLLTVGCTGFKNKKLPMAKRTTFEPYEFCDGDKIAGINV